MGDVEGGGKEGGSKRGWADVKKELATISVAANTSGLTHGAHAGYDTATPPLRCV